MKGKEVDFKLDTEAEVTAISDSLYRHLRKPTKFHYGPGRQTLNVLGQFETTLKHHQNTSLQVVYVIRGLKNKLLGLRQLHLFRYYAE